MFTRTPPPARSQGDRRRGLTFILAGIVVIYLVLTALGTLWTDFLWFDSVGYSSVWTKRWTMGIALGAVGAVFAGLVIWVNLYLADRLGPRFFPPDLAEEEELVARFHNWSEGRAGRIRLLAAAVMGLFVGVGIAAWRDNVFLYLSRQEFGLADPIFSLDVGFYMFEYPIIDAALGWLFNLIAAAAVLTALAHYLNGAIRIRRGSLPTFSSVAKIHLSILLALLALVRAAMYRMDALALLFSGRQGDSFFGPGYTDVHARLPALNLLMAIAVVAAVIFLVNITRPGWILALTVVAGWVVVSVAALLIYPAVIDRLQVQPQPLERESEYIANNIRFTRIAFGLDEVEVRDFPAARSLTGEDIEANALTVDNLRLWDTLVLPRTYQNLQEIRPYYTLEMVDTDRYMIDGEPTQAMIAVRELDEANLERTDWQNTRLIYTHGLGAVVSQANRVELPDGQPDFLLSDLPPVEDVERLQLDQPRIYFGETYAPSRPVLVKTGDSAQEVDMPVGGEGIQTYEYQGEAGVDLGSIWRRVAFAFRYRDLNLLISGQVRPESRVLVQRNVKAITSDLAPFLEVDSDPYPVITDGRVMWVVDLYTSSGYFPYSQPINQSLRRRLPVSTDLSNGLSYLSSSVKATVDAYDGTVNFYVVDDSDPLIRAWQETYPALFRDGTEMPEQLQEHLRYPQDMFRVQGELWLDYHMNEPSEFFTRNDAWTVPPDPATIRRGQFPGAELLIGDGIAVGGQQQHLREMLPYYLLTRLPGDPELSYVLLQPFNPRDKPNMSSFLVAKAPGVEESGPLIDFRMPQGILVGGTGQIGDRIQQNDEIAAQFTLWSQRGSDVIRGDILLVPIEDSLMYVQPIYLQSTEAGGFPEFRRVVVVFGDRIEWAPTLDEALAEVFDLEAPEPGAGEPDEPDEPDEEPSIPGSVQELLDQAAAKLEEADAALRAGNLGDYQRLVEEASALIQQAREAGATDLEAALRPRLP